MPADLATAAAAALDATVRRSRPVTGGSICEAAQVELTDGRTVFAKSAPSLPPDLLHVEAEGLEWLRTADAVTIPEVLAVTDDALVLEWVTPGRARASTDEVLGRQLAQLHRAGAPCFGWHRHGFIGTVPQDNTPSPDWPTFWVTHRIEPLARRAHARRAIDDRTVALVGRLADRIHHLAGPTEAPARVHGDLWSGNVHIDREGRPWLIDPAAYGGHREVDLAMLHLFGRPSGRLTDAYHDVFPLADGWQERLGLWQLEPLLVHAVLFGGGYGESVRSTLSRFTP